jgi:hypothetical protein
MEIHAALVIFLGSGGNVEVRKWNLLRMLWIEIKQGLADDRVIMYFLFVLITENQHSGRRGFVEFLVLSMLSWRRRRQPRIQILIALLSHPLLIETLLVHLVGQASLVLLVIVKRRTRIRPPIGIVEPRVSPPISTHASVAVVVAAASTAISPESHTATGTAEAAVEASRGDCRTGSSGTTTRERRTGARPTERRTTRMTGKPAVRSETTASAAKPMPAPGSVASAMLRRKGQRSQQEPKRRNHKRSMHAPIICPTQAVQPRN